MIFSLQSLPELLLTYRYAIIFPVAVVEGPIISILSGLLIASGAVNAYWVFLLLVAADIIGDVIFRLHQAVGDGSALAPVFVVRKKANTGLVFQNRFRSIC